MEMPELIGESAAMRWVRGEIRHALNVPFPVLIEGWERAEIRRGIEHTNWNVTRLARELGMSKRALFARLTRYGLRRPEWGGP